jgi:outer membrane lipoprotein-sorting protein
MISGWKTRAEGGLRAALLGLALLMAGVPAAWAFDLPELMTLLARQKSGEASFTEQRFVRGMDGPLESAGTLSFSAPDKLVRRTLSPRPESMTVEGNTLTLSRGGRTRTLALDSMPELLGMVDALRGTLSGDTQLLQRHFRSTLSGSAATWALDLQPQDERLAAQVRSVRLSGRQGEVLGVEMEFIGGDRSVMTITPQRGGAKAPS